MSGWGEMLIGSVRGGRATSKRRLYPLPPAVLLVLSGCLGDRNDDLASQMTVGDTVVVESRAPVHKAPARLRAVARYGALDAVGPATLVQVMAIAVAPDGSVYLYDEQQGIKRFHAGGDFSGWVAKEGSGPGEVRHTTAIAIAPNGDVAALDLGNRRVLVLQSDGASRVFRFPDGHPRYHEDALHYTTDGTLRVGLNPPFNSHGAEPTPRLAYLEWEPDSGFTDTIAVPSRMWERCSTRSERRHRVGFWEDRRAPYLPKATWALGPDGTFVTGCPDSFEFDVQRADGSVVRVRRAGTTPVELGREEREFLSLVGFTRLPAKRPAYARLIVPGDGRIWVWPNQPMQKWIPTPEVQQRSGTSEAWQLSSSGAFEVFKVDGTWVGTVPLPEEASYSGFPTERPVVIRGDTIWAITRDPLGVNYITRFAIDWH